MISAAEAREKVYNIARQKVDAEMIAIESKINNAIEEGALSISEDGYLLPETIQQLQKLGYKIEYGRQYNESYYIVSWREQ